MPFTAGLFWRHVGRSSENLAVDSHRQLADLAAREAKVNHIRFAVAIQHDVAGFNVPVNHACVMCVMQRIGNL